MKDISNIGLIMFGLLGDVLIRTPVIRALKDIYPNAKITAIVDPIGVHLLSYNKYVDELIVINRNDKNKIKKNVEKLKGIFSVYSKQFDLLLNLYNGGSSHLLVALSGAKYKLAFCNQTKSIYNVSNECDGDRLKESQSLYSYMISIVEPLSSKKYSLKPVFNTREKTTIKMQEYLKIFDTNGSGVYLLNLGASKEDKLLDMSKYIKLVEYIYKSYNLIPAIILNPSQEYLQNDFIENFVKEKNIPFIALDSLSLEEIASLMTLTKFTVSPDTGIMHLAMAMDVFILAIFTYTHPLLVDIHSDKFIPVYEKFDVNTFYQVQNISEKTLKEKTDYLFSKITN